MWFQGSCSCERTPRRTRRCKGIHEKVQELNDHILPPGRESRAASSTAAIWCATPRIPCCTTFRKASSWSRLSSFLFLGNVRGAIIVALTIPFSLLFAAICLNLKAHSGKPAVAGSAGLRNGGGWRRGDGGEYRPAPAAAATNDIENDPETGSPTPLTKSSGRCSTRSPLSSLRTCPSSRCSGWKGDCSSRWPGPWHLLCWAPHLLDAGRARCSPASSSPKGRGNGTTRCMELLTGLYRTRRHDGPSGIAG